VPQLGDIAYRDSNGAGRPIVFVHGNSASSKTWRHVLDSPFGERYRCLALDLPGHGGSARLAGPSAYSVPAYARAVAEFVDGLDLRDPVLVGWSLGGHIAVETAPALPGLAGLVIFGTPPIGDVAVFDSAFLPNPVVSTGFMPDVDEPTARAYATSFLAPGSSVSLDPFVADILATDPAARAGLSVSLPNGDFADEPKILTQLTVPLAVLHGREEALINLDYLRGLTMPTLWRGAVQVLDGVGHSPQEEAPAEFTRILDEFVTELP
jgi:pimeloyl-ACP methyl ester carboxylesterase